MIWFTSDHHFGHEPTIRFCDRPFDSVAEMDREMLRRYNAAVRPDDTVYFLGDVFFHNPKDTAPIALAMNGQKILIQGNHDKHSAAQYRSWGFTVFQEAVINLHGRRIRLSHYPYWPDTDQMPEVQKKELRYKHLRPLQQENEFLLCGHVHRWWKTQGRMINVGVDVWNFQPVSHSHIESLIHQMIQAEKPAEIDLGALVTDIDAARREV